jgi:ATP-dependent exoDNAse (exonuclease V) beta subunit
MSSAIKYISASAGTGKTHTLVEEITKAIEDGADPSGIVATTFTNLAARELEERLQRRLHEEGSQDKVDKIRAAYIGTVHGVCRRLLLRFPFESGLSPDITVMDEDEADRLLDHALHSELADKDAAALDQLADRLSQKDQQSQAFSWRGKVREIVTAARANGVDPEKLPEAASQSYLEMVKVVGEPGQDLDGGFFNAVRQALDELQGDHTVKKTTDYIAILKEVDGRKKHVSWKRWVDLGNKEPAKEFAHLGGPFKDLSGRLFQHKRFLDDIKEYLSRLFETARKVAAHFQRLKSERALVDYQDLENLTLELISKKEVQGILEDELSYLVVDEFQDTSPLQLQLFNKLAKLIPDGDNVCWVGDIKQSIYGFRGADPDLVDISLDKIGNIKKDDTLTNSYRSVPGLVDFFNTLFSGMPGSTEKGGVAAKRKENPELKPVRLIHALSGGSYKSGEKKGLPKALTQTQKGDSIAQIIRAIIDGQRVVTPDDHGEEPEPKLIKATARHVAVLRRSRNGASTTAKALLNHGIEVSLGTEGLLGTPEIYLMMAALRYVADSRDSLAWAELVTLSNELPLNKLIEQQLETNLETGDGDSKHKEWKEPPLELPVIVGLKNLQERRGELSLEALIRESVVCGRLDSVLASWGPNKERFRSRLANQERFFELSRDYSASRKREGLPVTILGFLVWLEALVSSDDDTLAVEGDADSVFVGTYHSAKGREWPVVLLADLEEEVKENLFTLRISSDPRALTSDDMLAGRELRYWVNPFGPRSNAESLEPFRSSSVARNQMKKAEEEALRLLYVGCTRARDQLILFLDPAKEPHWLKLAISSSETINYREKEISYSDKRDPIKAEKITLQEVVRKSHDQDSMNVLAWAKPEDTRPSAVINPSKLEELSSAQKVSEHNYGDRLAWPKGAEEQSYGSMIHRILAAWTNRTRNSNGGEQNNDWVREFLGSNNIDTGLTDEIISAVEGYHELLQSTFAPVKMFTELPVSVLNDEGRHIRGTIDHLLEVDGGEYIVIDHKIFPGNFQKTEERALKYAGQLQCYKDALASEGYRVKSSYINFITPKRLIEVQTGAAGDNSRVKTDDNNQTTGQQTFEV